MAKLAGAQFRAPDGAFSQLFGRPIFKLDRLARAGFGFAGQQVFVCVNQMISTILRICISRNGAVFNSAVMCFNIEGAGATHLVCGEIDAVLARSSRGRA